MHTSADEGGNRADTPDRVDEGVGIVADLLPEESCVSSVSLRLPGEVVVGVRAVLDGVSGLKLGCEMNDSVVPLNESDFARSSLSSDSVFHPKSSVSSAIIRALALFGGDLNWCGGRSTILCPV